MEWHGRDLETQPDHEHQPAEDQDAGVPGPRALAGHGGGHGGKLDGAERAGQEADAEEHHAGGAAPNTAYFKAASLLRRRWRRMPAST